MASTIPSIEHPILVLRRSLIFRKHREIWRRRKNVTDSRLHPYLPLSPLFHCSYPSLSLSSPIRLLHPPLPPVFRRCPPSSSSPMSSLTPPQAASTPPQSPPAKTVRVLIKGRVQGVFYRNWTVENATELGLKGWVRNRRDGSVEALFSGNPDSVHEMEQRCRRGPPAAMVTGFEIFPSTDHPGPKFERKPTL